MDELHAEAIQKTKTITVTKPVQEPSEIPVQEQELVQPVQVQQQPLQESQHLSQEQIEQTLQLDEHARKWSDYFLKKLRAQYSAPVDKPVKQPSGFKAQRERNARRQKGLELTPGGDEYTIPLRDAILREDKSRMLAAPQDEDVNVEEYRQRARTHHIDQRQLYSLCHTIKLDEHGRPESEEELQAVREKNLQFWEDFTSGDMNRQKPHLDRIVDEIITFQFTPSMFEPENLVRNMEKYVRMSRLLTALSDLRGQFPDYFAQLPAFKRDLLDDVDSMSDVFCPMVVNSASAHGYSVDRNEYIKTEQEAQVYREQVKAFNEMFRGRANAFADRREATLQREADRIAATGEFIQLESVQVIGEGAFKYGLPDADQIELMLQQQAGLTDKQFKSLKKVLEPVLSFAREYHEQLRAIDGSSEYQKMLKELDPSYDPQTNPEEAITNSFMLLMAKHRAFIDSASNVASRLAKSRKSENKAMSGALGFMAMKAMSYSGMIANLEAEFKYSITMGDQRSLKTKMDEDEMGALFEGRHMTAFKYQEGVTDPDGVPLPVLSQKLREIAGKSAGASDPDFAAILMTVEAFENFLETAQVPPCRTEEERQTYRKRVEALSNQLLAFNDRISARTMCYLTANSHDFTKTYICRALEESVLSRDIQENNFVRIAELCYRLRHNDFSDDNFNAAYTGVTLSEAIRKTRVAEVSLRNNIDVFKPKSGAVSDVYITINPALEQAVYRKAHAYRPWKPINENTDGQDIDVTKGKITAFNTTRGTLIDSHKSSRDVAVRRVDQIFGANVIADASHVSMHLDGAEGVISTKMEKAAGKEARRFTQVDFDFKVFGGSPAEAANEDTKLNLAHPETMRQIYWLQVIDAICGSADRHTGNFFLKTDRKGALVKCTGIDNDMAFGENFIPLTTEEERLNWADKTNNNYVLFTPVYEQAFPCIPLEIYEKVSALTTETLSRELRGSVRDSELETAIIRLEALKAHLARVPKPDLRTQRGAEQCAAITRRAVDGPATYFATTGIYDLVVGNYFALLLGRARLSGAVQ